MTLPASSLWYKGGCHCGAIAFEYRTGLPPEEWPIRACQCSFCRAHGALSTSDKSGALRFLERAPGALNRYRFALKSADFLLCRQCGVYIGAHMTSETGGFGIINVRALPSVLKRLPEPQLMDYDNEKVAERLARRESRWTPIL